MSDKRKVTIRIDHFAKAVFVETTEEKWKELTNHVTVRGDTFADGTGLDQDRMLEIIDGVDPDFKLLQPTFRGDPIYSKLITY
jgi:hypothetical protein